MVLIPPLLEMGLDMMVIMDRVVVVIMTLSEGVDVMYGVELCGWSRLRACLVGCDMAVARRLMRAESADVLGKRARPSLRSRTSSQRDAFLEHGSFFLDAGMRGHMAPINRSGIRHIRHEVHVIHHIVIRHVILVPRPQFVLIRFCAARSAYIAVSVVEGRACAVAWIWVCRETVHWRWTWQTAVAR